VEAVVFSFEYITSSISPPLRIWNGGDACTLALAVVCTFDILVKILIFGIGVPGYAFLIVAALFFGCIQLVVIETLGEYVGRISEVKDGLSHGSGRACD
jgi:polyisoprenyl-phosphate glycosyltransferase